MRTEFVTESVETPITMSPAQARALEAAGRRLASTRIWWGSQPEDQAGTEASVIRCRPAGSIHHLLSVSDAVGIVVTGDLQIVVQPKIPLDHLIFLLNASSQLPRLDPQKGQAGANRSFWELVSHWYLDQLQVVVRRDLIRDYRETEAQLTLARGRILPLQTAHGFYRGQLSPACRFQQFDQNNPLNRILKAAAATVAASPALPKATRRRATWLLRPFHTVEDLQPGDLSVSVERRNGWYAEALALARSILAGQGRSLSGGDQAVWTFLFRTPELVEEGLRRILVLGIPERDIVKKGRQLKPSLLTLNPDLVFDNGLAVGDVKYKLGGSDWNRSDLYQAVAFAAGFEASEAAVIDFRQTTTTQLPKVQVGRIGVTEISWIADPELHAEGVADQLCRDVSQWLDSHAGPPVVRQRLATNDARSSSLTLPKRRLNWARPSATCHSPFQLPHLSVGRSRARIRASVRTARRWKPRELDGATHYSFESAGCSARCTRPGVRGPMCLVLTKCTGISPPDPEGVVMVGVAGGVGGRRRDRSRRRGPRRWTLGYSSEGIRSVVRDQEGGRRFLPQ